VQRAAFCLRPVSPVLFQISSWHTTQSPKTLQGSKEGRNRTRNRRVKSCLIVCVVARQGARSSHWSLPFLAVSPSVILYSTGYEQIAYWSSLNSKNACLSLSLPFSLSRNLKLPSAKCCPDPRCDSAPPSQNIDNKTNRPIQRSSETRETTTR
jgi:hypothetical protein